MTPILIPPLIHPQNQRIQPVHTQTTPHPDNMLRALNNTQTLILRLIRHIEEEGNRVEAVAVVGGVGVGGGFALVFGYLGHVAHEEEGGFEGVRVGFG